MVINTGSAALRQVASAVADVAAVERQLSPAALLPRFLKPMTAAPLLLLDANLSPEALEVPKCCNNHNTHQAIGFQA